MRIDKTSIADSLWQVLSHLYESKGNKQYGLCTMSQYQHGAQAAYLAKRAGHSASLVIAALLHDIGHMVHDLGEHPASQGVDDRHEEVGANWLQQYFDESVVMPVRLHVMAKRYLCATDASYLSHLSPDSVESLALQGGALEGNELEAYLRLPYANDAVVLRRLDEAAKDINLPVPAFESFRAEYNQVILG